MVEDRRIRAARMRQSVRDIDAQMKRIQTEDRLFQRCGFGSDVHEIQLTALRATKKDLMGQLSQLQRDVPARPKRARFASWLMLPPALGAMLLQALRPSANRRPIRRPRVAAALDPD
jgi:hypothetical protein